ncbi:P27 family phage terminase small subunit [Ancylobacter sp. MQZ15Z-1]|uniref:P27 family phage terminase small subunit n=1 Tax=Ancylobacter mangrovi TaxID=2972472 RepID=A0A9X2PH91_9HYPH|nr:P27 family phage terminase small subunit [Ancylobacter mangrovi]MCS0497875.1 P27 family phage terminase small subunit [Ancylobacter mangrovi]
MKLTSVEGGEGAPPEPDWASQYTDELDIVEAKERWGIVTRELREAGTLAMVNGHTVQRLVEFYVVYRRAARQVGELGAITRARRTKVPQTSPYWTVMRQADEHIRMNEAELGLSPLRRNKAGKVQRGKKAPRAADSYLGSLSK